MVEHGGDVWVARPVGDDHQFGVSIIGADSTRDVELDYHQPVIAVATASTPVGVVLVARALLGRDAPDAQDPEDVQAVVDLGPTGPSSP